MFEAIENALTFLTNIGALPVLTAIFAVSLALKVWWGFAHHPHIDEYSKEFQDGLDDAD